MPDREKGASPSQLPTLLKAAISARIVARFWLALPTLVNRGEDRESFRNFVEACIRLPFLDLQREFLGLDERLSLRDGDRVEERLAAETSSNLQYIRTLAASYRLEPSRVAGAILESETFSILVPLMEGLASGVDSAVDLVEAGKNVTLSEIFRAREGRKSTPINTARVVMEGPLWGVHFPELSKLIPTLDNLLERLDLKSLAGDYHSYIKRGFTLDDIDRLSGISFRADSSESPEEIAHYYYLMALSDRSLLPLVGGSDDAIQLASLARKVEDMRLSGWLSERMREHGTVMPDPLWVAWFIEIQYPRLLGSTRNSVRPS